MWFAIFYSKGGDVLLFLLFFVFYLPLIACRFLSFLWLILLIVIGRTLADRALEDWRLGYGLKLALKINKYVVKHTKEEEPMKGVRFDRGKN